MRQAYRALAVDQQDQLEEVIVLGRRPQRQRAQAPGDLRQPPVEVDGRSAPDRQQGAGPAVESEDLVRLGELRIRARKAGQVGGQVDAEGHMDQILSECALTAVPERRNGVEG